MGGVNFISILLKERLAVLRASGRQASGWVAQQAAAPLIAPGDDLALDAFDGHAQGQNHERNQDEPECGPGDERDCHEGSDEAQSREYNGDPENEVGGCFELHDNSPQRTDVTLQTSTFALYGGLQHIVKIES